MIDELLEAVTRAFSAGGETAFVEEWVPKIVAELERLKKQVSDLSSLNAMQESQLLEADQRIRELE